MTDEEFDTIAALTQDASPAPVCLFHLPDSSSPGDWILDCLSKNIHTRVYGVALGTQEHLEETGDTEEGIVTAITGNGPTSEANARFYAMCHSAVPALVAECRRLRKLVVEQEGTDILRRG